MEKEPPPSLPHSSSHFGASGFFLLSFSFTFLSSHHRKEAYDPLFALFPSTPFLYFIHLLLFLFLPLLPLLFLSLLLSAPPLGLMASAFKSAWVLSLAVFFRGPWVFTLAVHFKDAKVPPLAVSLFFYLPDTTSLNHSSIDFLLPPGDPDSDLYRNPECLGFLGLRLRKESLKGLHCSLRSLPSSVLAFAQEGSEPQTFFGASRAKARNDPSLFSAPMMPNCSTTASMQQLTPWEASPPLLSSHACKL